MLPRMHCSVPSSSRALEESWLHLCSSAESEACCVCSISRHRPWGEQEFRLKMTRPSCVGSSYCLWRNLPCMSSPCWEEDKRSLISLIDWGFTIKEYMQLSCHASRMVEMRKIVLTLRVFKSLDDSRRLFHCRDVVLGLKTTCIDNITPYHHIWD